jgi:molecular chaperone HtpG
MMLRLKKYQNLEIANAATEELSPLQSTSEAQETEKISLSAEDEARLITRIKAILGDRVADVRTTQRLDESPARLVGRQGDPPQELQRLYRLLHSDQSIPQLVLEINPFHPLIHYLNALPEADPLFRLGVEQIYEGVLLLEGLHPNPNDTVKRMYEILLHALKAKHQQE